MFGQESESSPIAKIILKADTAYGDVRLAPYAWLKDKDKNTSRKLIYCKCYGLH